MAALPVSLQGPPRDKRPRVAQEGGAEPGLTELRKLRGGLRVSAQAASGYAFQNQPHLALRSRDRRRRCRRREAAAPGDAAATPGRDPLEARASLLEVPCCKAGRALQQPCRVAQARLCPQGTPRSPPRQPRVLYGERVQIRPGAGRPLSSRRCPGSPRRFSSAGPSAAGAACKRQRRSSSPAGAAKRGLRSGEPDCRTHHPQLAGGTRVGASERVAGDPEALAAAPDLHLARRGAGSAKAFCTRSEEAPARLGFPLLRSRLAGASWRPAFRPGRAQPASAGPVRGASSEPRPGRAPLPRRLPVDCP